MNKKKAGKFTLFIDEFEELASLKITHADGATDGRAMRTISLSEFVRISPKWEVRIDLDEFGRPIGIEVVDYN